MKLLVIGGTRFVGRHAVQCALARGHQVTLFHRGRTGEGLFEVEEILGDRDGEVDKLAGRSWDAVLDTCGYVPRVVEQSAFELAEQVSTYCFVSSISVYAPKPGRLHTESDDVLRFEENPSGEEITGESYGPFKALCEEAVLQVCGSAKTLVIRPGLIVGPHDPTDRFTYWIDRFSRREPILIPNRGAQPLQVIDVRDLAEFIVRQIESHSSGTFNAVGPARPSTLDDLWTDCRANCDGLADEVLVSDAFLEENQVKEWQDLPLLLPPDDDLLADNSKAIRAGLALRDLGETVRDTADWHRGRGAAELKAGMSRDRELELIQAWRSR